MFPYFRNNKHYKSINKNIIKLYCFVFIPLFVIFIVGIELSKNSMKNQTANLLEKQVETSGQHIVEKLNDIRISNYSLLYDKNVTKLNYIYDYLSDNEKYTCINNIRDVFSSICLTNSLVKNIRLYLPQQNKVYNSTGYNYGSYQNISNKNYQKIITLNKDKNLINYYYDNISNDNVVSVILSTYYDNPDYIIEIILNVDKLKDELFTSSDNNYYLFALTDDLILSNIRQDNIDKIIDNKAYSGKFSRDNKIYYSKTYKFNNGFKYLRLSPTNMLSQYIQKLNYTLLFSFLILIASFILYLVGTYRFIRQPLSKLIFAFNKIDEKDYSVRLDNAESSEYRFLYSKFNTMTENLDNYISRDYQNKILLQKSELRQLQSQINPHFLYNSLFILQRMICSDVDKEARTMANNLGNYFRYITKMKNDLVSLEDECNHAKLYVDIQKIRFENRIDIRIDKLPNEFRYVQVPKLILQPIIENAFNYGLKNKVSNGLLLIHYEVTDNMLQIVIEDNGEELTDDILLQLNEKLEKASASSEDTEMSGMLNINRRLIIYSDSKIRLELSRSDLGGLKTILKGFENV